MECNELKIVQNGKIEFFSFSRHVFFKKLEISFNFSKEIKASKIKSPKR